MRDPISDLFVSMAYPTFRTITGGGFCWPCGIYPSIRKPDGGRILDGGRFLDGGK